MKLYFAKGACSLAVRIIINEINIPCEFESVNLKTKQTEKGEDYLKINPKGAVPALQLEDQQVLTENAPIQQYLADKYNAVTLLPPVNDLNRYRVLEWLNYVSTEIHKGFGPLFNPTLSEQLKEELFKPILAKKFNYLNERLQQNRYLTNNQFTLADAYFFVMLTWFKHFKIDMEKWPNLVRYFNEMKNRPAIQKSLVAENLVF